MNVSEKVLATLAVAATLATGLLVQLEGYSPKPYLDVAGVLTECYGNTHGVVRGTTKSQVECEALLTDEVYRIGKMLVKDVPNHNVNTLAATISFVYNVGDGAYRSSTLRKYFKQGDFVNGCKQMNRWVYITSGGTKVKSKGLVNRRAKEVELCLSSP